MYSTLFHSIMNTEAVLAIRPGRPRPTHSFLAYPNGAGHPHVGLPEMRLAFDSPTQMKIPRTAPA